MKTKFFYFLIFLCVGFGLQAQLPDVVVNEYKNAASKTDEWTEILIVRDGLDLRQFYIGDNNASTDQWRPRLRFTNELFNNLRAGTIIVIDHADNLAGCNDVYDIDKSDGYIRVCAGNNNYFDGGDNTTLFISSDGDFISLSQTSGGVHRHGLGHDASPGNSVVGGGNCINTNAGWANLNNPTSNVRPCTNFSFLAAQLDNDMGLAVVGDSLTYTQNSVLAAPSPRIAMQNPTAGIPNSPTNRAFIRRLRQPLFTSQNKCVNRSGANFTQVNFNVDRSPTPFYVGDDSTSIRYMVLRSSSPDMPVPKDGKEYPIGQLMQENGKSAMVMRYIPDSPVAVNYQESSPVGVLYYRIYAFRYNGNHPDSARGRAYNTSSWADVVVAAPDYATLNGPDTVCQGDTAVFSLISQPGATYNWAELPAGATIISQNSQSVKLFFGQIDTSSRFSIIETVGNCPPSTKNKPIKLWPKPVLTVSPADQQIEEGESVDLGVSGADEYLWSPAGSLSGTTISNPKATPKTTTTYTVVGTSRKCASSANVTISVRAKEIELFIPNSFAPKNTPSDPNDPSNTFKLYGDPNTIAQLHFQVFNRMGIKVWETKDIIQAFDQGWDGTSKGARLYADQYVWQLSGTTKLGKKLNFKGKNSGPLMLVREQ